MPNKRELSYSVNIDTDAAAADFNRLWDKAQGGCQESARKIDQLLGANVEKKVALRVYTDDNGLKQIKAEVVSVGSAYEAINRQLEAAQRLQDGSVTKLRQQVNEAKQARDELAKVNVKADEYGRVISKANDDWVIANAKVESLTKQLNIASASSFWDKLKAELNLGPLISAGKAVNDIVNTFQSLSIILGQIIAPINAMIKALGGLQQFSLTFDAIGLSAGDVSKVFEESSRIALTYGTNIDSVRTGFEKLTPTIVAAGGSTDDVSKIVEALSTRFVAFGLSADESNRAMNAIVQAFGKGKLQAEELTQQISEADPAFRVDLANALGVSVAKLNEMVQAGEITTQVMIDILPKLKQSSSYFENLGTSATSAADALKQGNATIDQVRNQINSLNQLNLEALATSFQGFLGGVLDIQASITDLFTTIADSSAIQTLGNVLGALGGIIADVITAINGIIKVFNFFTSGIFDVINSVDSFIQSLIGIKPIATAVAALIGIALTSSVVELLKQLANTGAISKFFSIISESANAGATSFKTAFGVFQTAGATLVSALKDVATGAGQAFKNLFDGLSPVADQFEKTKNKGKDLGSQLSYLPSDMVAAAMGAGDLDEKTKGAGDGMGIAASGSLKLGEGLKGLLLSAKALLVELGPYLLILGAITLAMDAWNGSHKVSNTVVDQSKKVVENYNKELEKNQAATGDAAGANRTFEETLSRLRQENINAETGVGKLNAKYGEYTTLAEKAAYNTTSLLERFADFKTEGDISNTINAAKTAFNELDGATAGARQALADYSVAGGQVNEALKTQVTQQVTAAIGAYTEQLSVLTTARDKLLQQIADEGTAGATAAQKYRLAELNNFIQEAQSKVAAFKKEAEEKGIKIPFGADTAPAVSSIAALDEKIKALTTEQKKVTFGSAYYEEVKAQVEGLQLAAKTLTQDPYDLRIRIVQEGDLESVKSTLRVYEAIVENIKARAALENSYMTIIQAQATFKSEQLQKEKDAVNEIADKKTKAIDDEMAKTKELRTAKEATQTKELENLGTIKNSVTERYNKELASLKEQGASKDTIASKEKQLKDYLTGAEGQIRAIQKKNEDERKAALELEKTKEKEKQTIKDENEKINQGYIAEEKRQKEYVKNLELQQAKDKLTQLVEIQKAELAAFTVKQSQEKTEFQILKLKNEAAAAEARMAIEAAKLLVIENQKALALEAQAAWKDGKITDAELRSLQTQKEALTGAQNMVKAAEENYKAQEKISIAFKQQESDFVTRQAIERDTFIKNQQAQENAARAAVIALQGIQATHAQANDAVTRTLAGTIEVGGKVVNIYKDIANQDVSKPLGIANTKAGELTRTLAGTIEVGGKVANIYNEVANKDVAKPFVTANEKAGTLQTTAGQVNTTLGTTSTSNIATPFVNANTEAGNLNTQVGNVNTGLSNVSKVDVAASIKPAIIETDSFISKLNQIATTNAPSAVTALDKIKKPLEDGKTASSGIADKVKEIAGIVDKAGLDTKLAQPLKSTADSVKTISTSNLKNEFEKSKEAAAPLKTAMEAVRSDVNNIKNYNLQKPFSDTVPFTKSIAEQTGNALLNVQNMASALNALNGKVITITIKTVQAAKGGGPVSAGSRVTVNEVGKEAFLSSSGNLSMIKTPAFGKWTAPSDGYVIPNSIASRLSIPSTGVQVNKSVVKNINKTNVKNDNTEQLARAFQQAIDNSNTSSRLKYTENTQALHAAQIGKLTHAINKLVDKNWGVNVNIKDKRGSGLPNNMSSLL